VQRKPLTTPLVDAPLDQLLELTSLNDRIRLARSQVALQGLSSRPWQSMARPKQLPPHNPRHHLPDAHGNVCGCSGVDKDYEVFLLCAGRGLGKTLSGANNVVTDALAGCTVNPGGTCPDCPHLFAVVAPTRDHCQQTCFEGNSGILRALEDGEMAGYNKSSLIVTLNNGNKIRGFSAENEERQRGPNLSGAWVDELGIFRHYGVWDQMRLALRIGKHPRIYVTTTPRPTKLIRNLYDGIKTGRTHLTTGHTRENEENLSESALEEIYGKYSGTRLGRQELEGHLLEDIPGALWQREWFDRDRVDEAPKDLTRIVVSMDPAVTTGEDSDETGIIVAAQAANGHAYVLADFTRRDTPFNCCRRAVDAYYEFKADAIVGEQNNGGDFIRDLVHSVDPNVAYRQVYATRGKATRAQPVSSLYEQGKIHHIGSLPDLEDELCTWMPDDLDSPDRLDACVAAGTLVQTAMGEVAVETVQPSDLVWTRAGWRYVLAKRCTQRNAAVVTVELSNGRTLTGTPDHQILTENGWSRLDALVCGVKLSGWSHPSASPTEASYTNAPQIHPSVLTASTTKHPEVAAKARSTATFGKTLTPAKSYPMAGTSTTPTTTHSTTTQLTWSCSHPLTTQPNTPKSSLSNDVNGQSTSGRSLKHGTLAKQESRGIGNTESAHGKGASLSTSSNAPNAEPSSHRFSTSPEKANGTAPGDASTEPASVSTWKLLPVPSAEKSSSATVTAQNVLAPVPVHVVRSYAGKKSDVYDLMVAGQHEFLAEGVIVHNCVWAIHWLRDMFTGGWTGLYGTTRCTSCGQMVVSEGRDECSKCGAAFSV